METEFSQLIEEAKELSEIVIDSEKPAQLFSGETKTPSRPTVFGPFPYLGPFSSPFSQFIIDSEYYFLEDFEDGSFNQPGITVNTGEVISDLQDADSVDADDGLVDGVGRGHSYLTSSGEQRSGIDSVLFTFDEQVLQSLPNYFVVVTDFTCEQIGSSYNANISFEAYGKDGFPIISTDAINFGDRNNSGETSADRFWGIYSIDGVKAIKIKYHDPEICSGFKSLELDHIQYGLLK